MRFHLDVGADAVVTGVETIRGADWLVFCDIQPPTVYMISIEQQVAEKIHAYTLPRTDRTSTRVKDLIDIVLLLHAKGLDMDVLREASISVFRIGKTHALPKTLGLPPPEWEPKYALLAKECSLSTDMALARLYEQAIR